MKCRCGCNGVAKYLINGYCTPDRSRIINEPCCLASKEYLRDCAIIYNDDYIAIEIQPDFELAEETKRH